MASRPTFSAPAAHASLPSLDVFFLRNLLWVDCTAGFLAGAAMLLLSGWLSPLYAFPRGLLVGMGVVNLAYATYSFSLARRAQRPLHLIVVLAAANATWAVLCLVGAVILIGTASVFGLAHLIGEGLLVGGLGALEWTRREQLRVAT